jgi:hypothetical protein
MYYGQTNIYTNSTTDVIMMQYLLHSSPHLQSDIVYLIIEPVVVVQG